MKKLQAVHLVINCHAQKAVYSVEHSEIILQKERRVMVCSVNPGNCEFEKAAIAQAQAWYNPRLTDLQRCAAIRRLSEREYICLRKNQWEKCPVIEY